MGIAAAVFLTMWPLILSESSYGRSIRQTNVSIRELRRSAKICLFKPLMSFKLWPHINRSLGKIAGKVRRMVLYINFAI